MNRKNIMLGAILAIVLTSTMIGGSVLLFKQPAARASAVPSTWHTVLTMSTNPNSRYAEQVSQVFTAPGSLRLVYSCTYDRSRQSTTPQNGLTFKFWHLESLYYAVAAAPATPICKVNANRPVVSGRIDVAVTGKTYLQVDSFTRWTVQVQEPG